MTLYSKLGWNNFLSDGFDEYGSEYYSVIAPQNDYHIRLERYTAYYNTPIRLYKLHGSLDYVLYWEREKRKKHDSNVL